MTVEQLTTPAMVNMPWKIGKSAKLAKFGTNFPPGHAVFHYNTNSLITHAYRTKTTAHSSIYFDKHRVTEGVAI